MCDGTIHYNNRVNFSHWYYNQSKTFYGRYCHGTHFRLNVNDNVGTTHMSIYVFLFTHETKHRDDTTCYKHLYMCVCVGI